MGSMNHPFPMHIFRAYDIRGKVSLLGAGIIDAIAHGLAQQYQAAGQTRVAIGYDARISSPAFADIIARISPHASLMAMALWSPPVIILKKIMGLNGLLMVNHLVLR